MHRLLTLSGIAIAAMCGSIAVSVSAPRALAQAAQAQPAKQKAVKDAAEHELFTKVTKETDPEKKLKLLDEWREKYPDSDFKDERLQYYNTVNHPEKVVEIGSDMLAKEPENATALYLVTLNATKVANASPAQLAKAEKAAKGLAASLDKLFAPEKKPANLGDAEWKKARSDVENIARGTLIWAVMYPGNKAYEKKDFAAAEKEFAKAQQQYPDNAQVAYWLGLAIVSQKDVDKFPLGLYEIARAAALEPERGGLPEVGRKEVDAYLTKRYTSFHGSDEGLKELKELAKAQPTPPAGFKIKTASEIAAEREEQFRQSNPQLALWLSVKKELTGANGEQYFESNVKNAAVPKLKGTVISGKPAVAAKELLIGIENPEVAEVSLKLDAPIKGKPKPGNVIEWEGVPSAFSREPFLLTFDVEKAKIIGLETQAAPVKKAAKKAGAAKK